MPILKILCSESKSPNVSSLMKRALLSTKLSSIFCHINPNVISWFVFNVWVLWKTPFSSTFNEEFQDGVLMDLKNKSRSFFSLKRPVVQTTIVKLMLKLPLVV